jgi:hypothetical protein
LKITPGIVGSLFPLKTLDYTLKDSQGEAFLKGPLVEQNPSSKQSSVKLPAAEVLDKH